MHFEHERKNVGPGWQPLIENVHRDLTALCGDYDLLQIKEKFGGLRYYMALLPGSNPTLTEKVDQIVGDAERESFEICEFCGDPGRPHAFHGWVKTVCARCQQREEE